jgi:GNAT superfamily N-acetyltransferase
MPIVPAEERHFREIADIFALVAARGDTYLYDVYTDEEVRKAWTESGRCFVYPAEGGGVAGILVIRKNKTGRGSHVSNAGFMVHPDHRGKGIGKKMCAFALEEAKRLGFLAMQFNVVVSTNKAAVELWKKMGFAIVGTVPKGFRHDTLGLVDIYIMHRFL